MTGGSYGVFVHHVHPGIPATRRLFEIRLANSRLVSAPRMVRFRSLCPSKGQGVYTFARMLPNIPWGGKQKLR